MYKLYLFIFTIKLLIISFVLNEEKCVHVSLILVTMPTHSACVICTFLSVCLISLLLTPPCDGGKVLVFPVDGSHWVNMKVLIEELHARGHDITVIRSSTSWYIKEESSLYTSITIQQEPAFNNFFEAYLQKHMKVCHVITA